MKKVIFTFEVYDDKEPGDFSDKHSLSLDELAHAAGYNVGRCCKKAFIFFKKYILKYVAIILSILIILAFVDFFFIEHEYVMNYKTGKFHQEDCYSIRNCKTLLHTLATHYEIYSVDYYSYCKNCFSIF